MKITKTDREKSLSADEFVWDTDGHTEVHDFVSEPILRLLERQNVKSVLDIGCGNGAFSGLLADRGFHVAGIDHSLSGVERARTLYPHVQFGQHDLSGRLPEEFHSAYDSCIAIEVIEHLLLPRKLMEAATDALKPGGIFILTTPFHGYWKNLALALTNKFDDHWHPLRDFGHVKFFSKETVLQLFLEFEFQELEFRTVGRLPALARSMIISGRTRG